jgi:hypothetical protein
MPHAKAKLGHPNEGVQGMIEQHVIVTTKHGKMPAFTACPEEGGPFPPIILYMDAPGTREELRHHARRIARHGYFCILPDMYYRLGTVHFDIPRRDDAMSAVIRASMNSLTNALVIDDTAAILGWLDGNDKVKPGGVGCVGHCMSGHYRVGEIFHPLRGVGVAVWCRDHHGQAGFAASVAGSDQRRAVLRLRGNRRLSAGAYSASVGRGAEEDRGEIYAESLSGFAAWLHIRGTDGVSSDCV